MGLARISLCSCEFDCCFSISFFLFSIHFLSLREGLARDDIISFYLIFYFVFDIVLQLPLVGSWHLTAMPLSCKRTEKKMEQKSKNRNEEMAEEKESVSWAAMVEDDEEDNCARAQQ